QRAQRSKERKEVSHRKREGAGIAADKRKLGLQSPSRGQGALHNLYLHERVFALSCPADVRADDASLPRGLARGVEHGPRLLPSHLAPWLCLRPLGFAKPDWKAGLDPRRTLG